MTLQELMKLEEKLLVYENDNKFNISFQNYIKLDKLLNEVEEITNLFFHLMDEYKKYINSQDIKNDERNKLLNDYQNKLLNEDFNFDTTKYELFFIEN